MNASGASARMPKASSGPIIAPVVSIARCTPNAGRASAASRRARSARRAARCGSPCRCGRPSPSRRSRSPRLRPRRARACRSPRARSPSDATSLWRRRRSAAKPLISADDRRRAAVEAVDHAELQRREAGRVDEVERQDRRDHLGRDVGQQAREAEQDDGARNPQPVRARGAAARDGRRRGRSSPGLDTSHEQRAEEAQARADGASFLVGPAAVLRRGTRARRPRGRAPRRPSRRSGTAG